MALSKETESIVVRHVTVIESVANLLIERRHISGSEVEDLRLAARANKDMIEKSALVAVRGLKIKMASIN